jgi:hypothetical protein
MLSAAIVLSAGCSSGQRANFFPVSNYDYPRSSSSQGIIKISTINMTGDLNDRTVNDLLPPFVSGFSKENSAVSLVDGNKGVTYFDSELILNIITKSSLSAADYLKTVPLLNVVSMYGARGVDFNWNITVNYLFNNIDGQTIENGSFALQGSDRYKPSSGENIAYAYTGIGPIIMGYPDDASKHEIETVLMTVAGEEMAKRLSSDPIKSYFAQREKQRDGMDVKTYVDFLDKKKRLEKEREIAKAERIKGMDVLVKAKDQFADIKSGTVMVLGIGVSKYQSSQIPALKYADRDSQRVVGYFKNRYKLSDDRAMLLTNEAATAIKISRFITQNAMKLLDKDDTFILYFGGHGAPDVDSTSNDNDGLKKYLLLHDSELDSLPLTALSLNNLATLLGKLPCRRVVILLDSCFSGTAGVQTLAKLKSLRISEKSYKNATEMSGEGRVILAASSENQVSHEEDALQAGVFTHYLLEGLNGKADLKGDGNINILGLYEYVTREVSRHTQNKQSPVFRGTLDANIVF